MIHLENLILRSAGIYKAKYIQKYLQTRRVVFPSSVIMIHAKLNQGLLCIDMFEKCRVKKI